MGDVKVPVVEVSEKGRRTSNHLRWERVMTDEFCGRSLASICHQSDRKYKVHVHVALDFHD